ncbi:MULTISPECIES: inositol monophosphatase family protein [Halolamina]|uniref:fructose-bisphosphatase n=1 Tax=Halolamina pelagica TaxID=699431 RepID=A0A1I5MIE1_9EURY|nr:MULTISPECIES: inositol monophosphatase [Halolamina]NHX36042.1 inositol monophosphatase [Halolamina sp. R1-12]SFP09362.1 myo-inositol-1(or 4)-monophosphatase [Halolamina pelagica]
MDATTSLSLAREAATTGGEVAHGGFRGPLTVETKANELDSVTEFDREVQRRVANVLRADDPEAVIVGEEELPEIETRKTLPESGTAWIVDPIDGTNNFVVGNRIWCCSVTAAEDDEAVAAVNEFPALGDCFAAGDEGATRNGEPISVSQRGRPETFTINPVFGLSETNRRKLSEYVSTITEEFGDCRRFGSSQFALSSVAAGELDAAVSSMSLSPWDTVGGVHLVRQAGGTVTDLAGNRWTPGADGIIASNGNAHDDLVAAFE